MAVQGTEDHGPILTVMEARQARRGRHMAWVLGISLLLIVVGFTALYLYQLPHLSTTGSQSTVTSPDTAGFQGPPRRTPRPDNSQTILVPGIGSDGKGL